MTEQQFDQEAVNDAIEALREQAKTNERAITELEKDTPTPKQLRRLHAMLKFADSDAETMLKEAIPVSKRGPRSTK